MKAGAGLVYGTDIEEPGIRVNGVYQINEEIRAVADFGCYFPNETSLGGRNTTTVNWWEFNINANFILTSDSENGSLAYGIGGLNYLNVSVDSDTQFGSSSVSDSEVGINVGSGVE